MGLFDKFKLKKESEESRKNRLLEIFTELGCNPYDYEDQKMDTYQISLREELDGVIKGTELTYENGEKDFDYISLNNYKDGTKLLYLAINNRDHRETRNLVDKYNSRLGEDFFFQNEFTSEDLHLLQNETNGHLRTWHLTYFKLIIGYMNNKQGNATYVLVTEKK
ncbi:hypothetical protein V5097_07850 [Arenibacter palladensis]|uniref:hypothetical protein n=1 Tax=Arenibacter palladensis TaxID=237373 RepID=UPI002FD21A03